MARPKILLDEPSMGLSSALTVEMFQDIRRDALSDPADELIADDYVRQTDLGA